MRASCRRVAEGRPARKRAKQEKSAARGRYFMRHAPRTDAAAALGRDAPGPPREHTRTERTAITTFPHQLRAPPPKARAHASTFLLPKPRRGSTAGTHQIPHKPECTPRNHLGTPIRPSHCRSSAPIAAHPPPIPTICTQSKACLASNTTRACCHPLRDANARGAGHAAADPGTLGTQAEPHPTHRATRTRCLLGRRPRRRCMHAAAAAAQRLLRRRRWSTRTFQKRDGA